MTVDRHQNLRWVHDLVLGTNFMCNLDKLLQHHNKQTINAYMFCNELKR